MTVTLADPDLTRGETTTATFSFTEAPAGFLLEDVQAENGTLSNLTSTPDPLVFQATFTPNVNVTDATNVIRVGTVWSDAAGNAPASNPV